MITREWAEANKGAYVVYQSHPGARGEDGTIVRCNSRGVFVRYRIGKDAQLTRHEDLTALYTEEELA